MCDVKKALYNPFVKPHNPMVFPCQVNRGAYYITDIFIVLFRVEGVQYDMS